MMIKSERLAGEISKSTIPTSPLVYTNTANKSALILNHIHGFPPLRTSKLPSTRAGYLNALLYSEVSLKLIG